MKSLMFSIDLKSLALGALLAGGLLTLANFKPADKPAQQPAAENRRYQVVAGEHETIILDTQTGKFVVNPFYIGQSRWRNGDFNAIQAEGKK